MIARSARLNGVTEVLGIGCSSFVTQMPSVLTMPPGANALSSAIAKHLEEMNQNTRNGLDLRAGPIGLLSSSSI
ncbi:MAG TPA: hypothetical protein VF573_19320 [Paraburkholderia sp.]|uniref:hypothetical protein n=1 Tax=Paraburkholderia sp. TaxID=1926495 RepID=UPI002ED269A3